MGTTFSNLCKQFITVTVFSLLFSSLGFAQYYVDQDKVDRTRDTKSSYYLKPELIITKRVQLVSYKSEHGSYTPIRLGFNKDEYKENDTILISLLYQNENEWDKEITLIMIPNFNILSSEIEFEKENNLYIGRINPGEKRTFSILFKTNPNPKSEGNLLYISFHQGISSIEHRKYLFSYRAYQKDDQSPLQISPQPRFYKSIPDTMSKFRSINSDTFNEFDGDNFKLIKKQNNRTIFNVFTNSNSPANINITVHGVIYFENFDHSLSPLTHWLLTVYESNTQTDLDVVDDNDFHIDYPVESPGLNGAYSKLYPMYWTEY